MAAECRRRDGAPRHSLVLCTVGRIAELERLLESLRAQSDQSFEIVLVDQNDDDRLGPLLNRYSAYMSIHRLRSARGLSRARNAGLPRCRGELIALPDDDCWYSPDLLEGIARVFAEHPEADFVTCRWQDEYGRDGFGHWPVRGEAVSPKHIWTRAISFAIFFRRTAVERIGPFDERLGVGSGTPWGAGEETDYLLRAIEAGLQGWHEPACVVRHPRMSADSRERARSRALSYGCGIGFVLRKHHASLGHIVRFLARPLAGAAMHAATLNWRRARFHLLVFKGRCVGLLGERARWRLPAHRKPRAVARNPPSDST